MFVLSLMFFSFLYGVIAYRNDSFPVPIIRDALRDIETISPITLREPHYLYPIKYNKSDTFIYSEEQYSEGVTLIASAWEDFNWRNGIRIINMDGDILHKWNINPSEIYPESPHNDMARGSKNFELNYIHGSYLFPNGDILFNIEYLGLVRMNSCGEILWKLPYRTHHSISVNDDGNFWISGLKWVTEADSRSNKFKGLTAPFVEETALLVSPNGEIIKEISLLESLFNSGKHTIFWQKRITSNDVTHLNDVEELSKDVADDFNNFNAGDIVVSFKHIHAVAVLDQNGTLKWINDDDFLFQHDPDFEEGGIITIFDNRADGTLDGRIHGGSRIIAINPDLNTSSIVYPLNKDDGFYTSTAGKHQLLPNGNRLITEAIAGRVFEIDSKGNLVWEWYHQNYDDERVPEVIEGTRYLITKEDMNKWRCLNPE